jgi:hypothetical protein
MEAAGTFHVVPPRRSLGFRVKKQLNDVLRRFTGYQFIKAEKLAALQAAAKATGPRRAGRR